MMATPRFRGGGKAYAVEPTVAVVISERNYYVLRGRLFALVCPLIDGRRTRQELADLVHSDASAAEVYYVLLELQRQRLVTDADHGTPANVSAFWEQLELNDPRTSSVGKPSVTISALGQVPLATASAVCADLGLATSDHGDLRLVVVDDYLQVGLADINRQAIETGMPWLLVKPTGTELWLGPLFKPGLGGCWECLGCRLRANRPVETLIAEVTGAFPISGLALVNVPGSVQIGLTLAAIEAAKWLETRTTGSLSGMIVTFDLRSLETRHHALVRQPSCPSCGHSAEPPNREPAPLRLKSAPKRFTADGGHRTIAPETMLARFDHLVSPITGVIADLTREPEPEIDLIHNYQAAPYPRGRYQSVEVLERYLRHRPAGKGMTDAQARASAIGEAIERYSAGFRGDEICRRGSYRELAGEAVHPNACMGYSERQYQERTSWNTRGSASLFVPEPFDEDEVLEWSPLWSLTHDRFAYLPTAYCYFDYPPRPGRASSYADSNGHAAGTTLEEAILQGFLELVERDAVALWWYNRICRPNVDLDEYCLPYATNLRERYGRIGRDLWLLELTTDLGIPVVAALSRRTDRPVQDIIFGFGAHFDPKIAVGRAVTELNQCLTAVWPVRDDGSTDYRYDDPIALDWWTTATTEDYPYLVPSVDLPGRRLDDLATASTADVYDDIVRCVEICREQGRELLVLDQTRPDVALPVVKIVVPGFRHFWPRFAPGRLYDVPVRLGWLDRPRAEQDLNPRPMFM